MELYARSAYRISRLLTNAYSTSFGMSSRLFSAGLRPHIYAIYGLVRIADEIVDTYDGDTAAKRSLLDALEREAYRAMTRGYSVNPVVHAFALSANKFGIGQELIEPFFASMRLDIGNAYHPSQYEAYIYGSAEVVGLMCLKVFCAGDEGAYTKLEPGARALGRVYQKVNFLRDMAADYHELGRVYFPNVQFDTFSDDAKQAIEQTIRQDFAVAADYIDRLPLGARRAVRVSYRYYSELLERIARASADQVRASRIRVPGARKLWLFATDGLRGAK